MFCKMDGFRIFSPYLGIRNDFQTTTATDEVRLGLCNANSSSRDLVEDMQFNIHPCFKCGVRQWNPHTLIPESELMDTV